MAGGVGRFRSRRPSAYRPRFSSVAVARKITRGFSRLYQWYLLRSLHRDVQRKMAALGNDLGLARGELRRLNTFLKFDDRITGPWNGFAGAEDYYARTRSDVLLKHVAVPTLIVNANNDPLVPVHLIPHRRDLSDKVTLEITEGGGHLGFVCGRWPWSPQFWLEKRCRNSCQLRADRAARGPSPLRAAISVIGSPQSANRSASGCGAALAIAKFPACSPYFSQQPGFVRAAVK